MFCKGCADTYNLDCECVVIPTLTRTYAIVKVVQRLLSDAKTYANIYWGNDNCNNEHKNVIESLYEEFNTMCDSLQDVDRGDNFDDFTKQEEIFIKFKATIDKSMAILTYSLQAKYNESELSSHTWKRHELEREYNMKLEAAKAQIVDEITHQIRNQPYYDREIDSNPIQFTDSPMLKNTLQKEIDELTERVTILTDELKEKDEEIEGLKLTLLEWQSKNDEFEKKNKDKYDKTESQIEDLKNENNTLNSDIERIHKHYTDKLGKVN